MSSIRKNLALQTAYQIVSVCMPLVTAPYLAHVLGAVNLGIFSYTSSIVSYFTLFAMLGTINYGAKSIAEVKDDRAARSRVFREIYLLQLFMALAALLGYLGYLAFFCRENRLVSAVLVMSVLSCVFDISWLFFGVEDFPATVTRSFVIKLLTVASILLLVKTGDDLWVYTAIMTGGTLASQLVLWLRLRRHIDPVRVGLRGILAHLRPNLALFVPLLALSIYHQVDKTMLGALSSYEQLGYYYNSDKVINIPLGIMNSVGTVMLPRMSALFKNGRGREADALFALSLECMGALSIAMAFGIAAVAPDFIPVFYGAGYQPCVLLTILFTPIFVVKTLSDAVRTQFIIPRDRERDYIVSVTIGAAVNPVLNLLLIPGLGAVGAVVATFCAEMAACVFQFRAVRGQIGLRHCRRNLCVYAGFGLLMFLAVRGVASCIPSHWGGLLAGIPVGGVLYLAMTLLFWKKTENRIQRELLAPLAERLPRRKGGRP